MNLSKGEIVFPSIFISVLPEMVRSQVLYQFGFLLSCQVTSCQASGSVLCLNSEQNVSLIYRSSGLQIGLDFSILN